MAKRFLLLSAIALMPGVIAWAQPATQPATAPAASERGGGGRGEMMFQRFRDMTADLNLTDEQKKKIDEVLDRSREEMRGFAREMRNLTPQQRQEKLREMMMGVRDKVRAELNDEQARKLAEKMQNLRGQGRRGDRPPGQPEMNEEQKTQSPSQSPSQSPMPTTAPATAPAAALPLRVQQTLTRLNESLVELQLAGDQKAQAQAIVDDGKSQLLEMDQKVRGGIMDAEDLRNEAPQVFAAMRDQLAGVLTRQQQEKLRDAIQRRFERDNVDAMNTAPKPQMTRPEPERPRGVRERNDAPAPAALIPATLDQPATGPPIGAAAPDFTLEGIAGRSFQLSSFKNKPLVIEFGSYTSPSFRQRAAKMEELAKQYGTRANFLIIYTKEAHAQGDWEIERNREDGVKVSKHEDLQARKSAAKDARQALKITLPVAMDTMDDAIATAYGATENSAIVVGRDGKILVKQKWCDPYRLRAALDEALSTKPATNPT